MPYLNLQRRHGRQCAAKHALDTLTTEAEEKKRGVKRCDCPIFASGTLNGAFRKLSTRHKDWESARNAVEPYLQANSWSPLPPTTTLTPPPVAVPDAAGRPTAPPLAIRDAIGRFFADHEAAQTAEDTVKAYRLVLQGRKDGRNSRNLTLLRFADEQGLRFLQEFSRPLVRQLWQSWKTRQTTRDKRLGVLKSFFELFFQDGILSENPARGIKERKNRASRAGEDHENEPRYPFTDGELERMLQACIAYGKHLRQWPKKKDGLQVVAISSYRDYTRKWDGEDLAHFIELSYQTGLRISDVCTFHISRLENSGAVRLRALKNGSWVSVYVSERLQNIIRERACKHGPYIFGDPRGRSMHSITCLWRDRLIALWKECGPWNHKPEHHRFRHTFVRILLQKGTQPAIVAKLIGDTEATLLKHYSNWVPELQEAYAAATRHAFDGMPYFREAQL
jgi:integrase